jgi:hypothetical protein
MKKYLLHLSIVISLNATPNNPSNLTFNNITTNSVTLHWIDNSDDESGFKIFRDGSLIAIVKSNVTTYTDSKLTESTTYEYTIKATDDKNLKNILFAHGYQSSSDTWDYFANYVDSVGGWNVYRFDVDKDGTIQKRATELAQAILHHEDKIADNSLVSVGHSMGGLDLRYIVSLGHEREADREDLFYRAAKKISKIYTLASPHKGTGLVGVDDATKDMSDESMKIFNEKYPYSIYKIDGRKIPLLAYRFKCGDEKSSDGTNPRYADSDDNDGVVFTKKEFFNGAPHTQTIFSGKHSDDALCLDGSVAELEQTDILQDILDDKKEPYDVKDIIFFEDNGCKGDEAGVFSSSYKIGEVRCLNSDACSDNKISSLMIFPGIKDTTMELYDSISGSTLYSWVRIKIKDAKLSRPICIDSLESSLSSDIASKGVEMEYHEGSLRDSGVDGKVSYIDIK